MKNLVKILTALAAVAGAVYIIATYGDKIVAWAKKLLKAMPQCPACEEEPVEEVVEEPAAAEETVEEPAEEVPAPQAEEEPAPEVVVAETDTTATEEDFAE